MNTRSAKIFRPIVVGLVLAWTLAECLPPGGALSSVYALAPETNLQTGQLGRYRRWLLLKKLKQFDPFSASADQTETFGQLCEELARHREKGAVEPLLKLMNSISPTYAGTRLSRDEEYWSDLRAITVRTLAAIDPLALILKFVQDTKGDPELKAGSLAGSDIPGIQEAVHRVWYFPLLAQHLGFEGYERAAFSLIREGNLNAAADTVFVAAGYFPESDWKQILFSIFLSPASFDAEGYPVVRPWLTFGNFPALADWNRQHARIFNDAQKAAMLQETIPVFEGWIGRDAVVRILQRALVKDVLPRLDDGLRTRERNQLYALSIIHSLFAMKAAIPYELISKLDEAAPETDSWTFLRDKMFSPVLMSKAAHWEYPVSESQWKTLWQEWLQVYRSKNPIDKIFRRTFMQTGLNDSVGRRVVEGILRNLSMGSLYEFTIQIKDEYSEAIQKPDPLAPLLLTEISARSYGTSRYVRVAAEYGYRAVVVPSHYVSSDPAVEGDAFTMFFYPEAERAPDAALAAKLHDEPYGALASLRFYGRGDALILADLDGPIFHRVMNTEATSAEKALVQTFEDYALEKGVSRIFWVDEYFARKKSGRLDVSGYRLYQTVPSKLGFKKMVLDTPAKLEGQRYVSIHHKEISDEKGVIRGQPVLAVATNGMERPHRILVDLIQEVDRDLLSFDIQPPPMKLGQKWIPPGFLPYPQGVNIGFFPKFKAGDNTVLLAGDRIGGVNVIGVLPGPDNLLYVPGDTPRFYAKRGFFLGRRGMWEYGTFTEPIPLHGLWQDMVGSERITGVPIPVLESQRALEITDDKVLVHNMLEAKGLPVARQESLEPEDELSDGRIFFKIEKARLGEQTTGWVVKPRRGGGGTHAYLYKEGQTDEAIEHVKELLRLKKGVLIEERLESLSMYDENGLRLDWNLRVVMTHGPDGAPKMAGMEARVLPYGKTAVNYYQGAEEIDWETLSDKMGWDGEERARRLLQVEEFSKRMVSAFEEGVGKLDGKSLEELGFYGLDILWSDEGLFPIEINAVIAGGLDTMIRWSDPAHKLDPVVPVLEFMVRKAQGYRQRLEETIAEEPSPGFFHPLPEEFLRSGSVWLPYGAMLMNDEMGDRKTRKSLPETFAFIKRAMDSGVFEYESLLLAALASSESGKKENALVFMLHALQKQPDDLTFLEMLARAYLYQNRASKAMDVAKKMLRWHPNQVVGYMIMGESLTRLGRSEEALSHFERAVGMRMEVDPWKKSQFDFAHALAWMELGRMDKAREALASGTDAHPDDWVVRLSSWPVRGLGWLMRRHAQRRLGQEPAWAVQDWDAYMQWRNSVERSV